MIKFNKMTRVFFFFVSSLLLTTHTFAEPANLGLLMEEVKQYHDSGQYENEIKVVLNEANTFLAQRVKNKNNTEKLAIVLDIDETSLTNYNKMVARGFAATRAQLIQEILSGDSPPIRPTLELYEFALKNNIAVFFVTGRHDFERKATEKNLKEAGFKTWHSLYLRPDDYSKSTVIPFKSGARADITQKGYTIIASIGDQCSDLKGGYAEKTFKLPNPYYYLP